MQFSGLLFWLSTLTLILPSDFMGWIGVIGLYLGFFAFPFVYLILFFGNISWSFYLWYNWSKNSEK